MEGRYLAEDLGPPMGITLHLGARTDTGKDVFASTLFNTHHERVLRPTTIRCTAVNIRNYGFIEGHIAFIARPIAESSI